MATTDCLAKKAKVADSVIKRITPLKLSDGRVRSPLLSKPIIPKVPKALEAENSSGVSKGLRDSTASAEVSTDTADLILSLQEMPASLPLHDQIGEIQDFIYRQSECPALKDIVERFQHFELSFVESLWKSALKYKEEKKIVSPWGDMVFLSGVGRSGITECYQLYHLLETFC